MEWRRTWISFCPILLQFLTPWAFYAAEPDLAPRLSANSDICTEPEEHDAFSALQPVQPRLVEIKPAAQSIPKIVHHVYKFDISRGPWPNAIWEQSFEAWKKLFPEPEFEHMFWSDNKVESFVRTNCPKQYRAYAKEQRDIVRSDFSRYCILWRLGGIYADLDYQPTQNFYADLEPGKINLVQSPYVSETFQNSLMASPPHHMYWEKLMNLAQFTMVAKSVLLAAGPQLLETLPLTHSPKVVHTLSCNEFQRATHTSDQREKQASLRKHCKLLRPKDANDKTLKGIHWGTVSYNWKGLSAKGISKDLPSLFRSIADFHEGPKEARVLGGPRSTGRSEPTA